MHFKHEEKKQKETKAWRLKQDENYVSNCVNAHNEDYGWYANRVGEGNEDEM